jgi:16S rRNA processing protein RimM
VVKTHGLQGELVFFLDVDEPSVYKDLESVFIEINGKLVPFFIQSIQLQGDRALVSIEEINDMDAASDLVGKDLYLPLKSLPKLAEGQYYYHELTGFEVYDGDQLLGTVSGIFEIPNNHLLGVDHKGKEVLIPFDDKIIIEVNLEERKVLTQLPEGLLEVYLES